MKLKFNLILVVEQWCCMSEVGVGTSGERNSGAEEEEEGYDEDSSNFTHVFSSCAGINNYICYVEGGIYIYIYYLRYNSG